MIGKVISLPELRETANGTKVASLEVEVERNYANSEGVYENDIFLVTLWKGLAENCTNLCEVNSMVGIRGRMASKTHDTKEGNKFYNCEIIAEKISFIAK